MTSVNGDRNPTYGWVMVATAFTLSALSFGQLATVSVFLKPLASEFGWSRAETAFAYTLTSFASAVFGVLWCNFQVAPYVMGYQFLHILRCLDGNVVAQS